MIRVNIQDAKVRLSRYVDATLRGERVVVCRRNVPLVELVPVSTPVDRRRRMGMDAGKLRVGDDFDAPLPDDLMAGFR